MAAMGKCVSFTKSAQSHIAHFKDFSTEVSALDGAKRKIQDIINQEILITNYAIKESKYKENSYIIIQFTLQGEQCVLFTGSGVLKRQLEKYQQKLPFYTTIKQIDRYYTCT
jgi:hypothetical protein